MADNTTDAGSPANINALILVIESDCQTIIKAMRTLDDVIAPFTRNWPRVERPDSRRLPQTDYHWFCDYLGDAMTPIGFAIVGGKRGGDVGALLREIGGRLSAGREEFTELHLRIDKEHVAGRMNDAQVERVNRLVMEIKRTTLRLMANIERY